MSVSLPSLRVDAFSVGIASEIQKVRRTGLTFAPEAGSWRLRQVINKLIVEDDLYSAVDAAYSQGWRRVKLYFLTGLPTEMDDDTLGHRASSRPTSSTSGASTTSKRVARCRSAGSCRSRTRRSSGSARTVSTSCSARSRCCATRCKGTRAAAEVARPAATFAEGIASRGDRRIGRVIERVWRAGRHVPGVERALRARPLDRRDARRGPRPRLVRHPAPHPRRGAAVGAHRRRASTPTSSGTTGKRPWPSTGSPIAGGRRATTAGCAPTTPSSTWWRRRCRRRAARRARART